MNERTMNDREMLCFAYGALRAAKGIAPEIVEIIKKHLYPPADTPKKPESSKGEK